MNERENEGQEEGEYHFSDDQVNYDMEPDAAGPSSAALGQRSLFSKITARHKIILGVIVAAVLLSIIIKIMVPTAPPTDFIPAAATATTTTTTKTTTQTQAPPVKSAPIIANGQVTAPVPVATAAPGQTAPQQTAPPASAAPGPVPTPTQTATSAPAATVPTGLAAPELTATAAPPQTVAQTQAPSTVAMAPAAQMQPAEQPSLENVLQRLATVEQQNAAIVNLLQTEYAQKMADYETQATASRGKMEEMTKHLNRLEASMTQLTQALQTQGRPPEMGAAALSHPAAPHIGFTVQAIIPGRAWLKSEAGETVTVAEGDVLRDYGRITKIDPYDGIVNIDTGNRVVTLSYGMAE